MQDIDVGALSNATFGRILDATNIGLTCLRFELPDVGADPLR